jgi:hypothetical protein
MFIPPAAAAAAWEEIRTVHSTPSLSLSLCIGKTVFLARRHKRPISEADSAEGGGETDRGGRMGEKERERKISFDEIHSRVAK